MISAPAWVQAWTAEGCERSQPRENTASAWSEGMEGALAEWEQEEYTQIRSEARPQGVSKIGGRSVPGER
jgi:hypothetical protein